MIRNKKGKKKVWWEDEAPERAASERRLVSMALNGLNRGMAESSGERV